MAIIRYKYSRKIYVSNIQYKYSSYFLNDTSTKNITYFLNFQTLVSVQVRNCYCTVAYGVFFVPKFGHHDLEIIVSLNT